MPFPADYLFPSDTLYPSETPASGILTDGVLSSLAPWNDPDGAWQAWNVAYASMLEPIAELVLDVGSPDDPENYTPGWSVLLDPDLCPARYIPFGSQFVGVFIAPGTPEDEARAIWKARAGFLAGTPAGIVATAQRFLTGTQSCQLIERTAVDGSVDAYHFILVVLPGELTDAAALTSAVNAVKPAGVQWTLVATDGTLWVNATHVWNAETAAWDQANIIDP